MKTELHTSDLRPFLLRLSAWGLAICLLGGPLPVAVAQNAGNIDPTQTRDWAPAAIGHAQQMRSHKDADQGSQPTPQVIPQLDVDDDPSGRIATFQRLATFTANNAFFQNLGTNGRT